jgi:hypothetical protein
MATRIKMIHIKVERKGLAVIVGKNPVVVIGHLPLFRLYTTGGQLIYRRRPLKNVNFSKVSNELLKTENALVTN